MKKRYLSIVGLVGIAGALTVIMSNPALAGSSQPFFVFKDKATQTGAGSRDLEQAPV